MDFDQTQAISDYEEEEEEKVEDDKANTKKKEVSLKKKPTGCRVNEFCDYISRHARFAKLCECFFQILKSDVKEKPLGSRQTLLCFLDHFNSVGFPVVEQLQCNSVGFPVVE